MPGQGVCGEASQKTAKSTFGDLEPGTWFIFLAPVEAGPVCITVKRGKRGDG